MTRWLVRGKVLLNILLKWEELKGYFVCVEQGSNQDLLANARILADMLKDDIKKLYFVFAIQTMREFEVINAMFQTTDADRENLLKELD